MQTRSPQLVRQVVLIGLMASGKTTVGRGLAARLGCAFVDNDAALEARTGRTARAIAEADGAGALHAREAEALLAALDRPQRAVVAAAAGAVTEPAVVAALAHHDVVYLRADPAVLAERIAREPDDGHRPFVAGDALGVLREQFAERDRPYREIASVVVDAGAGTEVVVAEIARALACPDHSDS